MTSFIGSPVYDAAGRAVLLERGEPLLERVDALLGSDDAVDLDEDGCLPRVERVLASVRPRKRQSTLRIGKAKRVVRCSQRPERIPQARVERQAPVLHSSLQRLVVHDEGRVELVQATRAKRLVEEQLVQSRLVSGVSEPAAVALALELADGAEREVEHLDRVPGT